MPAAEIDDMVYVIFIFSNISHSVHDVSLFLREKAPAAEYR